MNEPILFIPLMEKGFSLKLSENYFLKTIVFEFKCLRVLLDFPNFPNLPNLGNFLNFLNPEKEGCLLERYQFQFLPHW